MKKLSVLLMLTLMMGLTACGAKEQPAEQKEEQTVVSDKEEEVVEEVAVDENVTRISLSNSEILVNEEAISEDTEAEVYKANDIIFYLEGQGITYGEGTEADEHSQIEANAHTVVHITKPGTYEISGTMDAGQIFVDLGEDAEEDPEAVVTLILNNADITCTVAPAILFYNVYECAEVTDEENASMDVNTEGAGANILLADGSKNKVYGSYVAKIYKSYELNEDGTEVVDAKKLHKYDGAVYSKKSVNVYGDTGVLNITAENEGLCSEMHMTVHGGNININSGNDGINASEDNVSVFAMNGGTVNITVTGETGEGDGIDSNGWLLINGGTVNSFACASSMDAGIDADKGIYINGGTVAATGNMGAEIAGGTQASISFMGSFGAKETYEVKDAEGQLIMEVTPKNGCTMLAVSAEGMSEEGAYSLWQGENQIAQGMTGAMGPGMGGFPGGQMPEGFSEGEMPEGFPGGEMPEGFPGGEMPEGFPEGEMPEGFPGGEMPEGFPGGQMPEGFPEGEMPEGFPGGERP